jgi:P-type Cu2+ transporter
VASLAANPNAPVQQGIICTHCDLPVPKGLVRAGESEQFCCEGCRAAHAVIMGCGLGQYYTHLAAIDADKRAANTPRKTYTDFDDKAFLDRWATRRPDGLTTVELYIEGVHCAACVWLIERLERLVEGVVSARLNLSQSVAHIVWDESKVPLSTIAKTIATLGYTPHAARGDGARQIRIRENRTFLIRIAAAGFLAANVMLVSIALYGEMWGSMQENFQTLFRWTAAALAGVSLAWPGAVFFRGALGAIRARGWSLDMPIALALSIGGISGLANTIRGSGEIYFDSLTMLVFLLLIGRWLQVRQQRSALDAVELMSALTPRTVRIVEDDTIRETSIEAVEPACIVEVRAHESIPVDGVITSGTTTIDTAILTGEPIPVPASVGDAVSAGSVNISSTVRIEALAVGETTRIGRVMRLVEQLTSRKGRVQTRVDRLAGWFVLAVVSLAAITLVAWSRVGFEVAIEHAVALLIVTCPCALALATPLASTAAIGRAARLGVLIKGADALDGLARPGIMLFDKTGTLTAGRFAVVQWTGDESVREAVSAIESHSTHPIARALAEHHTSLAATQVENHPGQGVWGEVNDHTYTIGSATLLQSQEIDVPNWAQSAAIAAEERVLTPIFIARDDQLVAVASLGDEIRDDAPAAIARLNRMGWRVGIVSGDRAGVVERVADRIGIDPDLRFADASPADKAQIVERLDHGQSVVMVGDGVNDAAALAGATTGVAVQGGAEASLDAADIYVSAQGVAPIVDLARAATRTRGIITRCLAFSLAYNAVVAICAVGGLVSPILGAVLMPISSLTVLTIAVRSRSFQP